MATGGYTAATDFRLESSRNRTTISGSAIMASGNQQPTAAFRWHTNPCLEVTSYTLLRILALTCDLCIVDPVIVSLCAASRVRHGAAGGRWQVLRRTALLTGVVIAALAVDTSIHPSGKSSQVSYKRGANRVRIHFISSLPGSGSTLLAARSRQFPRYQSSMSGPRAGMFGALPGEMSARDEFAAFVDDAAARQYALHGRFDLHHADSPAEVIFELFGSARAAMDLNVIAHNRVLQQSGQPEQRGTAVARRPKRAHQSHRPSCAG